VPVIGVGHNAIVDVRKTIPDPKLIEASSDYLGEL
jgi:hypothetical protein